MKQESIFYNLAALVLLIGIIIALVVLVGALVSFGWNLIMAPIFSLPYISVVEGILLAAFLSVIGGLLRGRRN